ncbi:hypothetical protein [Paenarthrobacter sp. NPDC091669]|uniref:hypothetical protein n=1 Tax=Paenarthrobacter sp. NPDC091669 TaxID=3364384 RepID=UPI00382A157B
MEHNLDDRFLQRRFITPDETHNSWDWQVTLVGPSLKNGFSVSETTTAMVNLRSCMAHAGP